MTVDPVIASLFDLPVVSEPSCDAASCVSLVGHLSEFRKQMGKSLSCCWTSKAERNAFQFAIQILKKSDQCSNCLWLPGYGCAVLKSTNGCQSGEVALNLISLDLHRFETRSKSSSGVHSYVDTGIATDYEVLHIGTCTIEELPEKEQAFQSLLAKVQSRTGDKRSASGGKQGHQRTPAFIHALWQQVFSASAVEVLPRGGFTDVGLHTGGESRSTAGPLVFSALNQVLQDYESQFDGSISSDSLFRKISAYFGLYISETLIDQYENERCSPPLSNAPDIRLEHAFHIIQSSALFAARASDDGLNMGFFVEWSKEIRKDIIDHASKASSEYSEQFRLSTNNADMRGTHEKFTFNIPLPYSPAKDNSFSESEIHKKESQNLGWLNLPAANSFEGIYTWVKDSVSAAKLDAVLSMMVLKKVEGFMWGHAKQGPSSMNQDELEMLASIVDNYREVLNIFMGNGESSFLSSAQLRSR